MLAITLLKLYPRAWQARYRQEMQAVLESHHVTWLTLCDLLLGALDAHLNPQAWRPSMLNSPEGLRRLRSAASTPFWLFPVFFFIWFVVSRGGDTWQGLAAINPAAWAVYNVLYFGQNVGSEYSLAFLAMFALELFVAVLLAFTALRTPSGGLRSQVLQLLPLAALAAVALAAMVRGKFDWLGTIVAVPLVIPPLIAYIASRSELSATATRLMLLVAILTGGIMALTAAGILALQTMALALDPSPAWPLQLIPGFAGIVALAALTFRALLRARREGTSEIA